MQVTSTPPLRVGVVGLGWAGDVHIKAYQQLANVEVAAIADVSAERLTQIGETYSVPHRYTAYGELLQRDDLDAVSVCTPNQFHAPVAIAALQGGKHVLCEKPLARSTAEGVAMVRAAREAGRVLQVAFNHRARGDIAVLKRHIEAGELGTIYHAKASWMRRNNIPVRGGWFMNRELAGGGPLIDLGVHTLDMALYLLGEPEVLSVSAATYAKLGPRGRGGARNQPVPQPYEVEDLATAFVRMVDGATLLLEASWAVYGGMGDDYGVTLYGTEGGAELAVKNYAWEDTLRIFTDVAGVPAEIRPQVMRGEYHQAVVRDFVEVIRSGDWAAHDGREGLRRTRIIEACYASAAAGREVPLSEIADVE